MKNPNQALSFGFLLITMAACGTKNVGNPNSQLENQKRVLAPNNIKDVWTVSQKKCDGQVQSAVPMETYLIDQTHFVRVVQLSNDEKTICKAGYAYSKIAVASGNETSGDYHETATLSSIGMKKSCWKKENGSRVGPPAEETGTFGPETLSAELFSEAANKLLVRIKNSKDCSGLLVLLLKK